MSKALIDVAAPTGRREEMCGSVVPGKAALSRRPGRAALRRYVCPEVTLSVRQCSRHICTSAVRYVWGAEYVRCLGMSVGTDPDDVRVVRRLYAHRQSEMV